MLTGSAISDCIRLDRVVLTGTGIFDWRFPIVYCCLVGAHGWFDRAVAIGK